MFESPVAAVVGATEPARTVAFLELFDLCVTARARVDAGAAAALYGVDRALEVVDLRAGGQARGAVRVVGPLPAGPAGPAEGDYQTGAHAFDLYTREIDASLATATAAGFPAGPVGNVVLGPLAMRQAMVEAPDGAWLVLIESERRRPSLLDSESGRRHSEGHSLVWAVASVDEALPFWRGLPGLTVPFDAPVRHPEVNRFMGLADPDVGLRMAMICDDAVSPMRLEFLEFVGRSGAARPHRPAVAGLIGPVFEVSDIDAARTAMAGAVFHPVTRVPTPEGERRACTGMAPGGVGFELRERP